MTDDELIAAVRDRAGVSDDEARAGLEATLAALGARLAADRSTSSPPRCPATPPPRCAAAARRSRSRAR